MNNILRFNNLCLQYYDLLFFLIKHLKDKGLPHISGIGKIKHQQERTGFDYPSASTADFLFILNFSIAVSFERITYFKRDFSPC